MVALREEFTMLERRNDRFLPLLAGLLVLVQLQCLLIPDDKEKGKQVPNQRPSVRITAGASSPDSGGVDYRVQFQWVGSDRDGVVTTFQYAMDDTLSENAWQDTTGFSALMRFDATTVRPNDLREFSDWHTFYIRAIDNEFAVSPADKRYFNARTIAPTSKITFPLLAGRTTIILQPTVAVRWEGEDLDSSHPDGKPIYYEYKLVSISSSQATPEEVRRLLMTGDNALLDTLRVGSKVRWVRVPSTVREQILNELPTSGTSAFAFAVRAVDEAGAIEPALDVNRNYIQFSVSPVPSRPRVNIAEESIGVGQFPATAPVNNGIWNVDVPAGRPLRFIWVGDASAYGSLAGNVNYALDIPDPEDETLRDPRGIGGWIGWGKWKGNQTPFYFGNEEGGKTHTLYVYMRDISDAASSTQKCTIHMRVVSFSFEKFALVVDDARWDAGGPTDPLHDRFLHQNVYRRLFDYGEVDSVSVYTDRTEGGQSSSTYPIPLTLRTLSLYRYVIWNFKEVGGNSGLRGTESDNKRLTNFLGAGGRLFMVGGRLAASQSGSFRWPIQPPKLDDDVGRAVFYFKYMYMRNTIVSSAVTTSCDAVKGGIVAARALNPAYPDLEIDRQKWDPWSITVVPREYRGGLGLWEGVKAGAGEAIEDLPGLDSLYAARTWNHSLNTQCGIGPATMDGAICGWRYQSTHADSLQGRQHGRIAVFNFQPYYFQSDRLADAGTAAVNWLVTGRDY
jgi:hypothetical protein